MNIAVVLFPRFTALDAIGPYETLQRLRDTTVALWDTAAERFAPRTGTWV